MVCLVLSCCLCSLCPLLSAYTADAQANARLDLPSYDRDDDVFGSQCARCGIPKSTEVSVIAAD